VLEGYVIPIVQAFLAQRALTLSEAKTRIVHVDEGFNFLGFESWLGEFEQCDKWSFCLTVARMAARQERP
jgi:hypothetical protein